MLERLTQESTGLYVHVPFCTSRCSYCTFVSCTDRSLIAPLLSALQQELRFLGARNRRSLATVYFGGGTPSLIGGMALRCLLDGIRDSFRIDKNAEFTVEANPEDVCIELLTAWKHAGVNRVSLGIQSLSDPILTFLNRRHDVSRAIDAVRLIKAHEMQLSIDFILGVPGFGKRELDSIVDFADEHETDHISAYLLEMDKPHQLRDLAVVHPEVFPDSDELADCYLDLSRALRRLGYVHYEVSSFAKPRRQARHNTRYWRQQPVLAAGPGACGQSRRQRWGNTEDVTQYIASLQKGESTRAWSRKLDHNEQVKEKVMLGLRLAIGLPVETIQEAAGLANAFANKIADFLSLGLAREKSGRIFLTPRGWLLSSELLATLF